MLLSTTKLWEVPKNIVFIDELPRNTMSKVQKDVLRETYGDLLNE